MSTKINFLLLIFYSVIGFLLTVFFLGFQNIGITNTNWFFEYDTISDFLALKYFLNDSWHFPIGLNPNYGNLTNSIVFSGAVPLLSFIAKIFKNFLPHNFHFFSIWIGICFSLQIFFSFKIIFNLTKNFNYSLISSFFFIFTPILIYRLGFNLSLGAHWLILAAIYLETSEYKKITLFYKSTLVIISSLVHFYFTIMIILMSFIFSFFRYLKSKNLFFLLKENIFILTFLLLTMYLVGYFVIPASDSLGYGYGYYKANLLSFFDPSANNLSYSWSLFLPNINNVKGEFEGFGYLGLGIILLNILLIFYIAKNFIFNLKLNIKYILLSFVFLLIAFSNSINIGSFELINIELPIFIYAPLSIIRASGRFIWPIYYLIIIYSIYSFYKLKIKHEYLLIFLLIQFIDFTPGIKNNFNFNKITGKQIELNDPIWTNISKEFKLIDSSYPSDSSKIFTTISSLLIDQNFEKTNIFRLGRYNRSEISKLRSKLYFDFNQSKIDSNKIYIIENIDHLRHLKFLFEKSNHGFFYRDNIWMILPNQKSKMNKEDIAKLNSINFKNIYLNEKIDISIKNPNGILGMGWSHPSYGRTFNKTRGAWTEGFISSLIFNAPKPDNLNNAIVKLNRILIKNTEPLLGKIYLNNEFLQTFKIQDLNNQIIVIDFSKKKLNKGINLINFQVQNPITPISKLESVDGRLLGFLIENIIFK